MPYLSFISDHAFEQLVRNVLEIGRARKQDAQSQFSKNVIDPFAALIESAAFNVDHQTWVQSETIRQCQKTLQNHIGDLHQKLLGQVDGWEDLGVGSVVDLVCNERKIIAEVKNKYNTVTGGKLSDQYSSLERLITPKSSIYKGYTAYFVNIIPKRAERFDKPFQPSDKEKGMPCARNENIRVIDGASFYELVTGEKDALASMYHALPTVIEHIFRTHFDEPTFTVRDFPAFEQYFNAAFTNNHE